MYYFKIKAGEMPEMVRAEMLPPFYKIREFLGGQVERLHPDDGKGIVHLVNPNAKFKKGFERPYQKMIVCSKEVLIYGNSFICGEDEDDHLRPLSWTEAFGVGLAMNIEKRLLKKDELKTCVLCHETFTGDGNNAAPLADGLCCDKCNIDRVVPERMKATIHEVSSSIKKNLERMAGHADKKPKKVREMLEEIAGDICDHICKYRDTEEQDDLDQLCEDCPVALLC